MKIPPQNPGNLARVNPETLAVLESIVLDLSTDSIGTLFWTELSGFALKVPKPEEGESLPIPLYLLGLCFMRLTTDADFGSELMTWAQRNQN